MDDSCKHWYDRFSEDPTADEWQHPGDPPPAPVLHEPLPEVRAVPPSEPAQPATSRSGFGSAVPLIAAVVVVVGVAAVLAFPAAERYLVYLRNLSSSQYVAPPFFSLGEFRKLRAGMTEEEVRERIGYPLERYRSTQFGVRWAYTKPDAERKGPHRLCLAVFHPTTGLLLHTKELFVDPPGPTLPGWLSQMSRDQAAVRVVRHDGSQRVIDTRQNRVVILAGTIRPDVAGVEEARARVAAMEARLHRLGIAGCEVIFVCRDADLRSLGPALSAAGAEDVVFAGSDPPFGGPGFFSVHACADGRTLTLPPLRGAVLSEELEADWDWALRRCLPQS